MIALLCPGQGAQHPGALSAAARLPRGAELIREASEVLQLDVLREDDGPSLARTDVVQRNTFLASVASARALEHEGLRFDAVAGHSIGAFAAAVSAGALDFSDALRLVDVRGRAMAAAFQTGYAMGAVTGLGERDVSALLGDARDVFISAENAPDQITVAGTAAAVERVLAAAHALGARTARRLEVTVPSHTPFMNPVRDLLRDAVRMVTWRRPAVPYGANCDGRAKFEAADVADDLVESVAQPVRWFDATQMLYERGVRLLIEVLPGDTLANLAAAAFPDATAISVQTSGVAAALARARSSV